MAGFIRTKFRTADDTSYIIRETFSKEGIPVIFKVHGIDLSTMASEKKFPDFDKESDELLETLEIKDPEEVKQIYFMWEVGTFRRT
jgi:hypothetical protein